MLSLVNEHVRKCEEVLSKHVREVAHDLRAVDAADLVTWLHGHRLGSIAAIIASSSEELFKPGTLRFAMSGEAGLTWTGQIWVRVDMEFHHAGIDCYFRLLLSNSATEVAMTYLAIDGLPCMTAAACDRFAAAVADARLAARPCRRKCRSRRA